MALFQTDSIALSYSSFPTAITWWIETFECKKAKLPPLDDPLPSDIALSLPGSTEAAILLSDRAEELSAGFNRQNDRPIIFTDKLAKAHEYLSRKGATVGPLQDERGTQFFEVHDPEGNDIEVCKEPS